MLIESRIASRKVCVKTQLSKKITTFVKLTFYTTMAVETYIKEYFFCLCSKFNKNVFQKTASSGYKRHTRQTNCLTYM